MCLKNLKIFIVNILLLLLVFLILEFFCHLYFCLKLPKDERLSAIQAFLYSYAPESIEQLVEDSNTFRPVTQGNPHKAPIILLGCTFSHGEFLQDNETLGYQLSKYTDRTVYNMGICSTSPRETLWLLRHSDKLPKVNPEYVILPYVIDHRKRIYMIGWPNCSMIMPIFVKTNDGRLKYKDDNSPILNSKILKYINIYGIAKKMEYSAEANDLISLYYLECKREIAKKYPSAKFVILVYCSDGGEKWELLRKNGIEILDANTLADRNLIQREYQISDDNIYPNAKAWQVVVPPLAKALKLK